MADRDPGSSVYSCFCSCLYRSVAAGVPGCAVPSASPGYTWDSLDLKENLEKLIWSFLLGLPFPHALHKAPAYVFSCRGWRCRGVLFTGSKRQQRAAVLNLYPLPCREGTGWKEGAGDQLTALPFCSVAYRKLIFRARIICFPQLQCSNRADCVVLYKDIHEVRKNTSSSTAAGKRPNSCCCNMDLKAVPSIYTCRYCNAAMQTVLCGLVLVDFIITRSRLWMAPFLCNICCCALYALPSDSLLVLLLFLPAGFKK